MIQLKSAAEIEIMARAGQIVAETLDLVSARARPGVSTGELDRIAEDFIRSHPGAVPAFKGLYDFPGTLCTSINHEVVHGIPSDARILGEGDAISLDCGVRLEGYFADAAVTVPVGELAPEGRQLLDVTARALAAGIAEARVGKRLGDVGACVQAVVEAAGFSVVRELVGHGVGQAPHEEPQVPNFGHRGHGLRMREGLVIAIEPMVNVGARQISTEEDGWTVVTSDGSLSAHFEHTVAVTANGPRVLTNLAARLGAETGGEG